jgi:predicted  nucleic acid-binding Zn-ribbon protein
MTLSRIGFWRGKLASLIIGSAKPQGDSLPATRADVQALTTEIKNMAKTMQDLVNEVAAIKSTDDSVLAFITGLQTQLTAAMAQAQQNQDLSQLDQVISDMETQRQALVTAITTPGTGTAPTAATTTPATDPNAPAAPSGTPSGT